jgi:hypothetical protein
VYQQFRQFLLSEESKLLVSNIKHIQIKKIIYIYFGFLVVFLFFGKSYGNEAKKDYFFEVQFGNLIVGKAEVSLINDEKKILVKAKTKTAGFLNTFYEYQGELSSLSLKNGETWKPHKFSTNGFFKNKNRISELSWDKDNSVSYKIDPVLDLKEVYDVNQSSLNNVMDPLTSIINVIENIKNTKTCDQSFKIFDGRRRYDLKIKSLGKENLINDRPKSFSGNVTICGVKMNPIGGHRLKSKWKPKQDKFSDFRIYFGKTSSGLLFPVRMNLERWFGTVVVRLINKNM